MDDPQTESRLGDLIRFLQEAAAELEWGENLNQTIMDLGCGDGTRSTVAILKAFPKLKSIVALDQAQDIIRVARQKQPCERARFYTAHLMDRLSTSIWQGVISRIVSVDCFNFLQDLKGGYTVLRSMLSSGGSAALCMSFHAVFRDCFEFLVGTEPWKYTDLAKPSLYSKFSNRDLTIEEHKDILTDVGFDVIKCDEIYRTFTFGCITDFYRKTNDFLTPFYISLPKSLHKKFAEDFILTFIDLNGFSDGIPSIKYRTFIVYIRKP